MTSEPATNDKLPSLADAPWLADASLQAVMRALGGEQDLTRIVGGAVRNALIGIAVADVDLASELDPQEVIRRANAAGLKTVPTGLGHGTVTVIAHGTPYEVTTLRRDVETDGRRAKVAFTDDWAADASRRDFTINALYAGMDGTIFDPLGGAGDVLARRVRFIGDPALRIAEDYLRILRFFRFSAVFSQCGLDAHGLAACIRAQAGLTGLSAERIRQEILRLLAAPHPLQAVIAMCDTGIFSLLLSSVPQLALFERYLAIEAQHNLHTDPLRRLCVLSCLVVEDAERLRDRLRLSRAETARLYAAAAGYRHMRPFMSVLEAKAGIYETSPDAWRDRVAMAWCRSPVANETRFAELYSLPQRWQAPALPWGGADLARHGVAPGPRMGRLLKALEAGWMAADFPSDTAALEEIFSQTIDDAASGQELAD